MAKRKNQGTEQAEAAEASNGEQANLSPLEKARLAPRGPRTSFYLVLGTDSNGRLHDVLYQAKSGLSAQRWIEDNAVLLSRLTSGVVVVRCKPMLPPGQ